MNFLSLFGGGGTPGGGGGQTATSSARAASSAGSGTSSVGLTSQTVLWIVVAFAGAIALIGVVWAITKD